MKLLRFRRSFWIQLEDGVFDQLVKPNAPIPPFITELTTITNNDVRSAERFPVVADAFIQFMRRRANKFSSEHNDPVDHIVLVAHNGKVFDIPFFVNQLIRCEMSVFFFSDARFGFAIDTLQVARTGIRNNPTSSVPTAYNLPQLFQYLSGALPSISHRAMADVKATVYVFRYLIFWESRQECMFSYRKPESTQPVVPPQDMADSDTSLSDDSSSTSESEEQTAPPVMTPSGDAWERNVNRPSVPLPMARFEQHFTSPARSRRQQTGLQCSPIDVNTPIRAWREVFKNTLLDKIVRYTNQYS